MKRILGISVLLCSVSLQTAAYAQEHKNDDQADVAGYAYVLSGTDFEKIDFFKVDGQGQLTKADTYQYSNPQHGYSLVAAQVCTKYFLYAALYDVGIVSYPVNADGTLGIPVLLKLGEESAYKLAVNPSKAILYAVQYGDSAKVLSYKIKPDGSLSQVGEGVPVPNLDNPQWLSGNVAMTLDSRGQHAYVSATMMDKSHTTPVSSAIAQYRVLNDGSLQSITPPTAPSGMQPSAILVDTGGTHAYVANIGWSQPGGIEHYGIGANGALQPQPGKITLGYPTSLVESADGKFVYAGSYAGGLYSYKKNADGSLTQLSPVVSDAYTVQVVMGLGGQSFYALDSYAGAGGVNVYRRDIEKGTLSEKPVQGVDVSAPIGMVLFSK